MRNDADSTMQQNGDLLLLGCEALSYLRADVES